MSLQKLVTALGQRKSHALKIYRGGQDGEEGEEGEGGGGRGREVGRGGGREGAGRVCVWRTYLFNLKVKGPSDHA